MTNSKISSIKIEKKDTINVIKDLDPCNSKISSIKIEKKDTINVIKDLDH